MPTINRKKLGEIIFQSCLYMLEHSARGTLGEIVSFHWSECEKIEARNLDPMMRLTAYWNLNEDCIDLGRMSGISRGEVMRACYPERIGNQPSS